MLDHWLTAARAAAKASPQDTYPDQQILGEIIQALSQSPKGLRRWSVMQAIRKERQRLSRDIPLKFEAEIERTFRRFCANSGSSRGCVVADAPFYRPADSAGEVWALSPNYAGAPAPEALSATG